MRFPQLIRNANHPRGMVWGRLMILKMNLFHSKLSRWGLQHIRIPTGATCLDVGCGGGRNVARLRRRSAGGMTWGADLSALSVRQSVWHNLLAILNGRSGVIKAGADDLPFRDGSMDVVTAFETIYYWPYLARSFREIHRLLRPGGVFLICNEDTANGSTNHEQETLQAILPITFYSNEELIEQLKKSGFSRIEAHTHKNGHWVAIVAHA